MILGLLALACLPHGAVGRVADLVGVAWQINSGGRSLVLERHFARTFRDGSNGWLFCLEGTAACAEMRSFPTGEVLTLRGLDHYSEADRAELVAVWPLLSPRIDLERSLISSWPLGHDGNVDVRVRATGPWERSGTAFRWSPQLGEGVRKGRSDAGELDATVQIDGRGTRNANWNIRYERCVEGETCVGLERSGTLIRLDRAVPRRAVAPCATGSDPARAPLCLADGTALADNPAQAGGLRLGNADRIAGEPAP